MGPQLERPVGAARITFHHAPRCGAAGAVHTYSALGLVLEGQATFMQGERFELRPGDVYLVPAGARHRFESVESLDAWGVRFCPPCFASTELGELFAPFDRARAGGCAVVPIPDGRRGFLATLCDELARDAGDDLAQRSLLSLILTEVSRAAAERVRDQPRGSLVADALRFIERNCLDPVTVADVAAAVHRSAAHVSTTVRRATGTSVKGWIIAGRLAEACNKLIFTDASVDAIADAVGYADPTHFIRLFRRQHGLTPAAWRARARASRSVR